MRRCDIEDVLGEAAICRGARGPPAALPESWVAESGMTQRLTFRRRQRLCRQRDLDRVFARRCSAGDHLLVVYVDANGLDWSRLAVKTGRRLGGAVARNRIRRRIREAFRTRQHELPTGLDVICIPQPDASAEAGTEDFARSLERLMRQARRKLSKRAGDFTM